MVFLMQVCSRWANKFANQYLQRSTVFPLILCCCALKISVGIITREWKSFRGYCKYFPSIVNHCIFLKSTMYTMYITQWPFCTVYMNKGPVNIVHINYWPLYTICINQWSFYTDYINGVHVLLCTYHISKWQLCTVVISIDGQYLLLITTTDHCSQLISPLQITIW